MNNILLIEDEKSVSHVIKAYLEREGYKVYCTDKGLKGIEIFEEENINLILLDLMLPDISGEEVCKYIREKSNVFIFMLTAKGQLNSKIEGFSIGADEYLVKPFSPRELVARVNALFRRIKAEDYKDSGCYDDGVLLVDYNNHLVKLKGKEISFTPNEFDILSTLIKNKGKVLSRDQLIDNVWGINFDGYDRTVDVNIKNIRKKIEEDTKKPRYIITVTKVGYKFGGED